MTTRSNKPSNIVPARVVGIQFSMLSPEEIRNTSVAEITSRDTYIGNKPVIGGLFDPRMGVLEAGLICPTDGLNYIKSPGYFGHIELARPVFYIQYLSTIIKILRCICIKCSKLRISKENNSYLLKLRPEKRWNVVFTKASKIKRCGESTENGCGCTQPNKIRKDGLATILSEWDKIDGIESTEGDSDKLVIKLTTEMVLKLFSRISDDDIIFMGFSPIWSRPEWMVCQVLAVPPPAVRPSVKHDSQQRSEDDISHILVNIIKANTTLQDKIEQNANESIINDWHTVLQYYVATQVDNNLPGVASVAQRSGRPLKSIRERLGGKTGRVRGNLMGKRVDFSARSVITPDPNIKIWELGIPKKIAMNLTKPVRVNKYNIDAMYTLVLNGPDTYPGAKILEKKNGDNISLRYIDRNTINIEYGDMVHRHIIDGDYVLFNRQPTLHRPSMMAHRAKIMNRGYTFRLNLACCKPYNADFDGDEMNMHMPQDAEAETELKELVQVPYQLISPANNKPIIGIFQDSLLGSYLFTRKDTSFNKRETMNMMALLTNINLSKIGLNDSAVDTIPYADLLTQILPPISLKYKTKQFTKDDNFADSNFVMEVKNGKFFRGQIEKGVFGDTSKGLIHRICNDYGHFAASEFINNLQNLITQYMCTHAYSVGISDLIADKFVNQEIIKTISDSKQAVQDIIDESHLGVFNNDSGASNKEEYELKITNVLSKAMSTAQTIGHSHLGSANRFITIVNAGSKGSMINIAQMISCLGQQIIECDRIPYGYDKRTLPHYTKFNDEAISRGFIENSFISGLTPEELFFHAMSGRIGLIDTAVKTSRTGYIQRRLIKSMEDLIVHYDLTVRNNKNKIIQFKYGYDGFDTIRIESQDIPLVKMNYDDIYAHYQFLENRITTKAYSAIFTTKVIASIRKQKDQWNAKCSQYIDFFIEQRDKIIKNVFEFTANHKVNIPVAFAHIIESTKNQMMLNPDSIVDITPLEALQYIEEGFAKLKSIFYCKPNRLFETMYFFHLSPKDLLFSKRFNKKSLLYLIETIVSNYKRSVIQPGECTGMIAAQSIGEPTTQMTLNTFHHTGVGSKTNVTRGVMRIEEILSLSENPKNKSLTIYTLPEHETDENYCQQMRSKLEYVDLRKITKSIQIYYDPNDSNTSIEEDTDLIQQYQEFNNLVDECVGESEENKTNKTNNNNGKKWLIRIELDHE
jgi:DNA-directed RNA polymerase II subunit RPB1